MLGDKYNTVILERKTGQTC